jgi:3-hydroxybutyryl-CoA dehydrogenase
MGDNVPAKRVGVLGAGLMGSEIAQAVAASGIPVTVVDIDPAALARGVAHIGAIGERRVAKGRLSADEAAAISARVTPAADVQAFADCDVIIEAVPEIMDLKRALWRQMGAVASQDALLASNTSGLSITDLGRESGAGNRTIGLHFFNPASVMRLVEVVRGNDTGDATVARGTALVHHLGKVAVGVHECPGFLVNRILVRAFAEAFRHARHIAPVWTTDEMARADAAAVGEGPAPMGPFTLADLVGIDTLAHIRRDLEAAYGERFSDAGMVDPLVAAGRLGAKSGGGFYDGSTPESAPDDRGRAVAERYYLGALHEACLCLEEDIAALSDIDVAMRLGCGWELGPLEWADAQGPSAVAARFAELGASEPRLSVPSALADRAARNVHFTEAP